MLKKLATATVVAAALLGAGVAVAAPAGAATTPRKSCTSPLGDGGAGYATYSYDGTRTYVTRYDWTISGVPGTTENNIHVELRRSKSGADPTLDDYNNSHQRNGSSSVSISGANFPSSWDLYANFNFTFDTPGTGDWGCSFNTVKF
jgi:hypothetical protein